MGSYILNDKDVTDLDNGLISLHNALDYAKDLYKDDSFLVTQLKHAMKTIKPVKDRVVGEKDVLFNRQMDYFDEVRVNNNFFSTWSKYSDDDFRFEMKHNLPIGAELTCYYILANENFKIVGDTWFDVWKIVDAYLDMHRQYVGDHIFIEDFKVSQKDHKHFVYITLGS